MGRGRPRIHADDKARKRAFYARHRESERARISKYRAQKSTPPTHQHADNTDNGAAVEILARCRQVTDGTLEITADTDMRELLLALKEDLAMWKTFETDEEEWVALTISTIKLQCNNRPLSELHDVYAHGLQVLQAVQEKALEVFKVLMSRSSRTRGGEETLIDDFRNVELQAARMRSAFKQLELHFKGDRDTLSRSYAGGNLIWQGM